MIFAYIRVSTDAQTGESQRFEIDKFCDEHHWRVDRWVEESVSGTVPFEKRSLGKLIKKMRRGDLLLCTEISRLGRNMLMVMAILNACIARGIRIRTIKDRFELGDDLNSKIIAFAFALASEIERNLISQRTREALAAKKEKGVSLGRPKGASKKRTQVMADIGRIRERVAEGESISSIAKELGISRNTLSKYLKEK